MNANRILITFCLFPALVLLSNCENVFRNPDLVHGNNQVSLSRTSIEKLKLVSPMEQQILAELKDTSFSHMPESDFFELQDRFIHAVRSCYQDSIVLEYPSEKRSGGVLVTDIDNPRFDPYFYLKFLDSRGLTACSLSSVDPIVIRAVLRTGNPVMLFGELHYTKKVFRKKVQNETADTSSSISLYRKHEMFDVLYSYTKIAGSKSRLPGESSLSYFYENRSGFNFTCNDETPMLGRALNIYGSNGKSTWIFSKLFVFVKKGDTHSVLANNINAEATREGYMGNTVKVYPLSPY